MGIVPTLVCSEVFLYCLVHVIWMPALGTAAISFGINSVRKSVVVHANM